MSLGVYLKQGMRVIGIEAPKRILVMADGVAPRRIITQRNRKKKENMMMGLNPILKIRKITATEEIHPQANSNPLLRLP
jgi:5'-3' exonuclease